MKKENHGEPPQVPQNAEKAAGEPRGSAGAHVGESTPGSAPTAVGRAPNETPNWSYFGLLKVPLAQALLPRNSTKLKASADTDFLLALPNRRGLLIERSSIARSLHSSATHATAALGIVLDRRSLKPIKRRLPDTPAAYQVG